MNAPVHAASILGASGAVNPDRARDILGEAIAGANDGEIFSSSGPRARRSFDDSPEERHLRCHGGASACGWWLGKQPATPIPAESPRPPSAAPPSQPPLAKRGYAGVSAEGPRATNEKLYGDDNPLGLPDFSGKVALLQEIDAYCRARDPRVVQVMASVAGKRGWWKSSPPMAA